MTNLKLNFRNMNRLSFIQLGLVAMCLPLIARAAQDTWVNNGTVANPTVDATNVINSGIITTVTASTFDTSNTRNYTNSGTISGSIGFRFDNAPRNSSGQLIGVRKLAANFHNRNSGNISAADGSTLAGFAGSLLYIQATNIINQGNLAVGAGGVMQLTGTNINVSRGGFGAVSVGSNPNLLGSFNDDPAVGQFYPDIAVSDIYWAQTNLGFRVDSLISPQGVVTTPRHEVQRIVAGVGYVNQNVTLSIIPDQVAAISNVLRTVNIALTNSTGEITNIAVPTNVIQQAVFVAMPGFPASIDIGFVPSSQPTNDYESAILTLSVPATNVLTGTIQNDTVYFQDTLAGETDRGLLINYFTTLAGQGVLRTYRPRSYILSRIQQDAGLGGNATVGSDFFYARNFATNIVSGPFAAYSGNLDNILVRPPNIPAGTATNLTGRVEVRSDSLDMTLARIRGEGLVSLQTRHLVGSTNAAVDCENLSLELGSTNGLLRIKDITKTVAQRLRGDVRAWSAQWSNSYAMVFTNNFDTSTNPAVMVPLTNTVNVLYHMMVYDLRSLTNFIPVAVQQFKANATNIVMDDNANIVLEFLLNGKSFTLNGQMNLSGGVANWYSSNAPSLLYFTNNGTLTLPNEAHFGDDAPQKYIAFVNRGFITSYGQNINSEYTELAGTNAVTGSFAMVGTDAKVDTGKIDAGGDVLLNSATLKFNRALVQSDNRIVFSVTNALFDNGPTSSNTLICGDGLSLNIKPATGDLLGTTVRTIAPNFGLVSHYWSGADRGATTAGFSNNVALGRLVLAPNGFGTAFEFIGTGVANGLYVDLLDLSQLTDLAGQLLVDPNITIYYAAAKLSFTPSGGVSPEQYLEDLFGGRLRWVSKYAGANSSVDVVINGNQTVKVNRALRDSTVIDSDSDGIPNYYDASPFDGVQITSTSRSTNPAGFKINWNAAPNTIYRVEYRTTLATSTWTTLLMTTNNDSVMVPWSVIDTNAISGQQRYYRVSYNPNGP